MTAPDRSVEEALDVLGTVPHTVIGTLTGIHPDAKHADNCPGCMAQDALATVRAELERLRREVDLQMQDKLDAQSLLANIVEAIGLSRASFDLNDTWGTAAPTIIMRLAEIVKAAEAAEARVRELESGLREIRNVLGPDHFSGELDGLIVEGEEALRIALALLGGGEDI